MSRCIDSHDSALQDTADFEWAMWFTSFRNFIIFALSGHVLFAKICSMTAPQVSNSPDSLLLLLHYRLTSLEQIVPPTEQMKLYKDYSMSQNFDSLHKVFGHLNI